MAMNTVSATYTLQPHYEKGLSTNKLTLTVILPLLESHLSSHWCCSHTIGLLPTFWKHTNKLLWVAICVKVKIAYASHWADDTSLVTRISYIAVVLQVADLAFNHFTHSTQALGLPTDHCIFFSIMSIKLHYAVRICFRILLWREGGKCLVSKY